MNRVTICNIALLVALSTGSELSAAENLNVVSPQKRQELINETKRVLATKELSLLGRNPFHAEASIDAAPGPSLPDSPSVASPNTSTVVPLSARDLLQRIATSPSLKPSGYFVLSGQPTLVFGQKRVKAGNFLTITFEGVEYTVEIVSIDRPNFTLRLNREEFTRPIK
jgi:hypothetical protein